MTNLRRCADQPQGELPRVIAIDEIGKAGFDVEIDASDDERVALARRFGLVGINDITARVRIKRIEHGGVRVRGSFAALLVQSCVVTLEPFEARVEDIFDVLFVALDGSEGRDVLVDAFGDDPPEPLCGDFIDVGEVVAQNFGLAIDNYPRRPGATFAGNWNTARPGDDEALEFPFSALRKPKLGA